MEARSIVLIYFLSLWTRQCCFGQEFEITTITPSNTSMIVEWAYPSENEASVFIFSVTATYQGPCDAEVPVRKGSASPTLRTVTLTNLEEFSEYNVTVRALPGSSGGDTIMAMPAIVFTLPAAPSAPPSNVRTVTITSSSITIVWDPPPCLAQNSVIGGYRITVRDGTDIISNEDEGADTRTYTATNLNSGSVYFFEVSAIGSSGSLGPPSPQLEVTAESTGPDVATTLSSEVGATTEVITTTLQGDSATAFTTTNSTTNHVTLGADPTSVTAMTTDVPAVDLNIGLVVGIVSGSLVVMFVVITSLLLILLRQKRNKKKKWRRKSSTGVQLLDSITVATLNDVALRMKDSEDFQSLEYDDVFEQVVIPKSTRAHEPLTYEVPLPAISKMSEEHFNNIYSTSDYIELLNEAMGGKNISTGNPYFVPGEDETTLYSQLLKQGIKTIPYSDIRIITDEPLGMGEFGAVYQGVWSGLHVFKKDVAIKTLGNRKDRIRLLQEAATLSQFRHPNLVALYGISNDNDIMMVVEYVANGSLYHHLKLLKPRPDESVSSHLAQLLLEFSQQICLGMQYLAQKGFIHRCLQSKGVLVSEQNVCKISDIGKSRDLTNVDYYISTNQQSPDGWLAPETILYNKYSTASDVWSYGCVLYEIWSLGHEPFENMSSTEQIIDRIETGFRLPPPPGCPKEIYNVMIQCWAPKSKDRPEFGRLLRLLLANKKQVLYLDKNSTQLGAPLDTAEELHWELQQHYSVNKRNF